MTLSQCGFRGMRSFGYFKRFGHLLGNCRSRLSLRCMGLSYRSIMVTFQCQFINFCTLLIVCSLRLLSDSLNCPLCLMSKSSSLLEDSLLRLCGDILN